MHGRDPLTEPRAVRQIVGYAGAPSGTPNLTVVEELTFAARLAGLGHAEREEAVGVMLQLVDLHDRRHRAVGTLSRGDLRRLSIARALVHDPLLVLLDGPFDGLDAAARSSGLSCWPSSASSARRCWSPPPASASSTASATPSGCSSVAAASLARPRSCWRPASGGRCA